MQGVKAAGSNPATPTKKAEHYCLAFFLFIFQSKIGLLLINIIINLIHFNKTKKNI